MFFFTSGLAFHLIDRPSTRELFTRYCSTLAMPNRHQLAGPLLDSAYAAERGAVTRHLKNQRHVALVSDDWSNPRRESLINFIVTAPKMRFLLHRQDGRGNGGEGAAGGQGLAARPRVGQLRDPIELSGAAIALKFDGDYVTEGGVTEDPRGKCDRCAATEDAAAVAGAAFDVDDLTALVKLDETTILTVLEILTALET
ncbi:hypothetical protein BBJ28_00018863 [Nothophytophthora sp. Chile5]|nr:hypothetical protein BBJ28_00018863 [Nothophytophthora sp. Chile5]